MAGREDAREARQFFTADVPFWNTAIMAGLVAVGWTAFVLLTWSGRSSLVALSLGLPLLVAFTWLWTAPRSLWLEGDVLVCKELWREQRLRVSDIRTVKATWVPYKGQDLHFIGRAQDIRLLSLGAETEPLRFEMGQRLIANGPSVLEDGKARQR